MISYTDTVAGITPDRLQGFFVGWPNPPSPETHLEILQGSSNFVLAIDDETGNVVGFVSAVSDGVLSAYIPLLEVLPSYQNRGIGTALSQIGKEFARRMGYGTLWLTVELTNFRAIHVYEKVGFRMAGPMQMECEMIVYLTQNHENS